MFSKRRVIWTASGVVVLVLAIATFLLLSQHGVNDPGNVAELLELNTEDSLTNDPLTPEIDLTADATLVEAEVEVDVRVACHDPLGEFSEECLLALDAYFLDKPFVWRNFDWLPVLMTFRRVFSDPVGDRDRILAALEKPECRLEEGEIRWDLKESCHAESLANYANLVLYCQDSGDEFTVTSEDLVDFSGEGDMDIRRVRFEKYDTWWNDGRFEEQSRWAGESLLKKRWLIERACVRQDIEEASWYNMPDGELGEVLRDNGKRLELFSEEWDDPWMELFFLELAAISGADTTVRTPFGPTDAFNVLQALAARLGDEWAASVYHASVDDDDWNIHEARNIPWKEHVGTMHVFLTRIGGASFHGGERARLRMKYADARRKLYPRVEAMGESFLKEYEEERTSAVAFGLYAGGGNCNRRAWKLIWID